MDVERPRRLRMSELLDELGARCDDPPPPEDRGLPAGLSAAEGRCGPDDRDATLPLGDLVDRAAEGGFAFLVGLLTLIAIPFFGLSTPFGLAIALIGLQMLAGMARPWLPQRARRRPLSLHMLDRVATMLARRTRWIVKLTRRRWEPLVRPRLAGLCITLLALGLALPIPIPGSNLVFLIPLFTLAVGVLERDGAWIAAGLVMTLVDLALLVVFGGAVVLAIERLIRWVS